MNFMKFILIAACVAAALAPDAAFAKKKRNTSVPRHMTSEQRIQALNYCRKKYPGPYTWNVEFGAYDGKRQWLCVPSY
jgi:hypothetical protein